MDAHIKNNKIISENVQKIHSWILMMPLNMDVLNTVRRIALDVNAAALPLHIQTFCLRWVANQIKVGLKGDELRCSVTA